MTDRRDARGQPIRVLVMMDAVDISGPARQLLAVADYMKNNSRITLTFVAIRRNDDSPTQYEQTLRTQGFKVYPLSVRSRFDTAVLKKLSSVIEDSAPDIVQTHGYRAATTMWMYSVKRRKNKPQWLAFFHGATTENFAVRMYNIIDVIATRFADHIVVVANPQRSRFRGLSYRTSVIHNAFLSHVSIATAAGVETENRAQDATFAVIGRLSSEKGVDLFIRAMHLLKSMSIPATAIIAGDGVDRPRLESMVRGFGLQDTVRFLGHCSSVAHVFQQARLVVIPSRSEGMPNVLLEAVSAGRRVISTDVGNIREVIGPYSSLCRIIPPNNIITLANAMREEIATETHPLARERLALMAAYTVENRAHAIIALYSSLRARRHPGPDTMQASARRAQ